jgi:hypothetical protein
MTTTLFNAGGGIQGTTVTATTQFSGSGAGLTNLPAGQITLGAANAAVITDGSSKLTTETTLAPVRGGTGSNSSAATGIPHVTAGTWTYSGITSGDLAGGFSVTNSQTTATSANTANTIVARDSSGNFSASAVNTTSLPQTATQFVTNGTSNMQTANIQTTNTTATPILTFTTANSSVFSAFIMISCVNTTDSTNNTGYISYHIKATTSSAGAVTITGPISQTSILDSNVPSVSSTVTSSGNNNITINVIGISAKNIDWIIRSSTLSQA